MGRMGKSGSASQATTSDHDRPTKIVDKKTRNLGPSDFPHLLDLGTDVSAKFKGAFCEARVLDLETENVEVRITLKDQPFIEYLATPRLIIGKICVGENVLVLFDGKQMEATIQHVKDMSRYKVGKCTHLCGSGLVFNDGDEKSLRRNQMVLKGAKHFDSQINLDNLPLDNPDRTSNANDGLDLCLGNSRSITRQLKAIYQGIDPDMADTPRSSVKPAASEQSGSYFSASPSDSGSDNESHAAGTPGRHKRRKHRKQDSATPQDRARLGRRGRRPGKAASEPDSDDSADESAQETVPKKKSKASTKTVNESDESSPGPKEKKKPNRSKSPLDSEISEGVLVVGKLKQDKKVSLVFGIVIARSAYLDSSEETPRLLEVHEYPIRILPDGKLRVLKESQLEPFNADKIPAEQLGSRLRKSYDLAMRYARMGQLPEDWTEESVFGSTMRTRKAALASRKRRRSQSASSTPANNAAAPTTPSAAASAQPAEATPSTSHSWHMRKEVRDHFFALLHRHYDKSGLKLTTQPTLPTGDPLDLVHLFRVVRKRGGGREMGKALWNGALDAMGLRGVIGWELLREMYQRHLEEFEDVLKRKKDPLWFGDKDKKREKVNSGSSVQSQPKSQTPAAKKAQPATKSTTSTTDKQLKKVPKSEKADRKTSTPSVGSGSASTSRLKSPTDLDEDDGHVPADMFYSARVVDARRVPTEVILRVLTKLVDQVAKSDGKEPVKITNQLHIDALEELGRITMVFVHYCGWNNRYDEWVTLDRLKVTPETRKQSMMALLSNYNFPLNILEAVHNFYASRRITKAAYHAHHKKDRTAHSSSDEEDTVSSSSASRKKRNKELNPLTQRPADLSPQLNAFLYTDEGFSIPEVKPEKVEKDAYDDIPNSELAAANAVVSEQEAHKPNHVETPKTKSAKPKPKAVDLREEQNGKNEKPKEEKKEKEKPKDFKHPKTERQNSKKEDELVEEKKRKKENSEASSKTSVSSTPSSPSKEKHRDPLAEDKKKDKKDKKRDEKDKGDVKESKLRKEKSRDELVKKDKPEKEKKSDEKKNKADEEKTKEKEHKKDSDKDKKRKGDKEHKDKSAKPAKEEAVVVEAEPAAHVAPKKSADETPEAVIAEPSALKEEDPLSSLNDTINSVAHQLDLRPEKRGRTAAASPVRAPPTSLAVRAKSGDAMEIPPPQFSPTPPSVPSPAPTDPHLSSFEGTPVPTHPSTTPHPAPDEARPGSSKSSASSSLCSAQSRRRDGLEAAKRELMRPLSLDMNVKSPTPQLPSHASSTLTAQSTFAGLQPAQLHTDDLVPASVMRQFEVRDQQLPLPREPSPKRRKKSEDPAESPITSRDVQNMLVNLGLLAPSASQQQIMVTRVSEAVPPAQQQRQPSLYEQLEQAKACERQVQTELLRNQLLYNQLQLQFGRDNAALLNRDQVELCQQALVLAQRRRQELEQQIQLEQIQNLSQMAPSTSSSFNSVAHLLQQTHLTIAQLSASRRQQLEMTSELLGLGPKTNAARPHNPHTPLTPFSMNNTAAASSVRPDLFNFGLGQQQTPSNTSQLASILLSQPAATPILNSLQLPNAEQIRMSLALVEQQYGHDIAWAVQQELENRVVNQLLVSLQQATPAPTPPQLPNGQALSAAQPQPSGWTFSGSANPQTMLQIETLASSLTPSTDRTATPRALSADVPSTSAVPPPTVVQSAVTLERVPQVGRTSVVLEDACTQQFDALVQAAACEDCGSNAAVFERAAINTLNPALRTDVLDFCAKQQHLGKERRARPQLDTSGMTRVAQKQAVEKRKQADQLAELREPNGPHVLPVDPRFQDVKRVFEVPGLADVMSSIGFEAASAARAPSADAQAARQRVETELQAKSKEQLEAEVQRLLDLNNLLHGPALLNGHAAPADAATYDEKKRASDREVDLLKRTVLGMADLVEREQVKLALAHSKIQHTESVGKLVRETQEQLSQERERFEAEESMRKDRIADIQLDHSKLSGPQKGRKLF